MFLMKMTYPYMEKYNLCSSHHQPVMDVAVEPPSVVRMDSTHAQLQGGPEPVGKVRSRAAQGPKGILWVNHSSI